MSDQLTPEENPMNNFTAITSKLGVHVGSTNHRTADAAAKAARAAIRTGKADSAAVWSGNQPLQYFGSGR